MFCFFALLNFYRKSEFYSDKASKSIKKVLLLRSNYPSNMKIATLPEPRGLKLFIGRKYN